jgi:dihydrofolate reductase
MSRVALVVAVARNGVIGKDGGLPWRVPGELKRFKELTLGKPVIMGRKTWESLPNKPLPGRQNIVVTRQADYKAAGADVAGSVAEALEKAGAAPEVCIIGGAEIYGRSLPLASRIYLSEIPLEPVGDAYFPRLDMAVWRETGREAHEGYVLRTLDRI